MLSHPEFALSKTAHLEKMIAQIDSLQNGQVCGVHGSEVLACQGVHHHQGQVWTYFSVGSL